MARHNDPKQRFHATTTGVFAGVEPERQGAAERARLLAEPADGVEVPHDDQGGGADRPHVACAAHSSVGGRNDGVLGGCRRDASVLEGVGTSSD